MFIMMVLEECFPRRALRSTGEEAQYPVAQRRRQAQVMQLVYEFGGDDSVECRTVINEKQSGIAVFIFQVS